MKPTTRTTAGSTTRTHLVADAAEVFGSAHHTQHDSVSLEAIPVTRSRRQSLTRRPFDLYAKYYEHENYVPYVHVSQRPIPSGIELMNEKVRFYLKPTTQTKVETMIKDGVSINTTKHSRINDGYSGDVDMESLDLGTVQLRRIIEQIRGLKSNSQVSTYDPLASRAAGLPTYCEYLQGAGSSEMSVEQLLLQLSSPTRQRP
jgi:hypothetical protein